MRTLELSSRAMARAIVPASEKLLCASSSFVSVACVCYFVCSTTISVTWSGNLMNTTLPGAAPSHIQTVVAVAEPWYGRERTIEPKHSATPDSSNKELPNHWIRRVVSVCFIRWTPSQWDWVSVSAYKFLIKPRRYPYRKTRFRPILKRWSQSLSKDL